MSFAVDLWDQFEEVVRKVSQGKEFSEKVADFMRKRQALEREYSKKLQALTKSADLEIGTLNNAWIQIKEETDSIAKRHNELAEALDAQVATPITTTIKEYKKKREKLKLDGRKLIKDLGEAEKKKDAAKAAYDSARRALDEAKEKYEQATHNNAQTPQIEKLNKKVKEAAKKAEQADQKYAQSVDACKLIQDKHYNEEMPRILAEFESTEKARIECMKEALINYVKQQETVAPEVVSACGRMMKGAEAISAESDLKQYVNEKRTNNPKPPRAEYEPYFSAADASAGRARPTGPSAASTSGSGAAASSSTTSQRAAPTAAAAPVAAAAPAAAQGIGRCRALYDYDATEENELSFKQGDLITILQKDASGWWQGELNGVIGVFPSVDWVEEITDAAPSMGQCRALYAYEAENEYELSIQVGEILTVETEDEGWYCGTNSKNQYGRFPSNFCEPLK